MIQHDEIVLRDRKSLVKTNKNQQQKLINANNVLALEGIQFVFD